MSVLYFDGVVKASSVERGGAKTYSLKVVNEKHPRVRQRLFAGYQAIEEDAVGVEQPELAYGSAGHVSANGSAKEVE